MTDGQLTAHRSLDPSRNFPNLASKLAREIFPSRGIGINYAAVTNFVVIRIGRYRPTRAKGIIAISASDPVKMIRRDGKTRAAPCFAPPLKFHSGGSNENRE